MQALSLNCNRAEAPITALNLGKLAKMKPMPGLGTA